MGDPDMISTASALYAFYSNFGLPAYEVNTVPDDVTLPYITYLYNEPQYQYNATHYAQIFMRTNSNTALLEKAGDIVSAIGEGVVLDSGVVIRPSTPLVQIMHDASNPDIRIAYISLQLNALHTPGT